VTGYEVLAHSGNSLLPAGAGFALDTSTHFERAAAGKGFDSDDFLSDHQFNRPLDKLVVSSGFRSGLSVPMALGDRVVGALSLSSAACGWEPSRYQRLELEATAALLASHVLGDGWAGPVSVLIAHCDPLVAAGIRDVLGSQWGAATTVITHPGELRSGVSLAKPDVVVVGEDFGPPDVIARVLGECPWHPPVVFLAPRDAQAARAKALDLGASAFVPHARADTQLGPLISSLLRKVAVKPEFQPATPDGRSVPRLTRRERDVLVGLDAGRSLREIARSLAVSETTLKGYARDLYLKLGAHSRGEAVHAAREQGLLTN
jgi:DNA-binding NarL/FixJ family response regulator